MLGPPQPPCEESRLATIRALDKMQDCPRIEVSPVRVKQLSNLLGTGLTCGVARIRHWCAALRLAVTLYFAVYLYPSYTA